MKVIHTASRFGSASGSASLCVRNAKTQISYWGPDTNLRTDLPDYAHKEWGGLLGTLYLQRWRTFRDSIIDQLDGKQTVPDYFSMESNGQIDHEFGGCWIVKKSYLETYLVLLIKL